MKMPGRIQSPAHASAPRAVVGATTTTVASVLPVFLVGGLAVQIGDELHFDPAGLGFVVSAYFAIGAFASVPSGALVERFGPATMSRIGIAISAGALATIAIAVHSYPVLLILLAVAGVGNAIGQLASNASLAVSVPPRRQGLSFGIKQGAIPASTLLSGLAVPAVALTAGWRWAFGIAALFALCALALVPPSGRKRARQAPDRGERATGALIVVGLGTLLGASGANALGTFLVDSSVAGGLDPAAAGLALTAGSLVCLAARIFGGWLADRRAGGHLAVVAGSLVAGACGFALLAVPNTMALVAGVLIGFGLGWSWPGLLNFAVVQLHPEAPAAATSITQTGVYVGGCAGPLAFGSTAAGVGYPAAWLAAAIAMVLSAVLMVLGGRLLRARHAARRATLPAPARPSSGHPVEHEPGSGRAVREHVAE
jgi:MFS family permease